MSFLMLIVPLLLTLHFVEIRSETAIRLTITSENGTNICEELVERYGVLESENPNISQNNIQTLFRWCTADERCSQFFNPSQGRANITVFSFLADQIIRDNRANLWWPLFRLLCSQDSTLESVAKEVWLLTMMAGRDSLQPRCDVNHKIQIDLETLSVACVCMENRVCSDSMFDLTLYYIVLAVLTLLAVLFLGGSIYKMAGEIDFMNHLVPSKARNSNSAMDIMRSIFG